jgi:hypothetical protein
MARLKPRPLKTKTVPGFFSKLLEGRIYRQVILVV